MKRLCLFPLKDFAWSGFIPNTHNKVRKTKPLNTATVYRKEIVLEGWVTHVGRKVPENGFMVYLKDLPGPVLG